MTGWKTWSAVIAAVSTGVWLIISGQTEAGLASILYGLGLLGIGGKLDKLQK